MKYIYEVEQKSLAQRIRDEQIHNKALKDEIKAKKSKKEKRRNFVFSALQVSITVSACIGIMLLMGLFEGM